MSRFKKAVLIALVLLIIGAVASAASAQGGMARIRVAVLIGDAPALQVYGSGTPYGGLIDPGSVSGYLAAPADTYQVAFAPEGKDASASVVSPFELVAEADHDYLILLLGSLEAGTGAAHVIDETAAFGSIDPEADVPFVFIHNLSGAPSLSLWVSGQAVAENVAYDTFVTGIFPAGMVDSVVVAAADDPENVVLAPPFFANVEFAPHVEWVLTAAGVYPGQPGQDEFLYAAPTFKGDLKIDDGGALQVGTPVEGVLAVGERIGYDLTLDADASLDILVSASEDSSLDAYVRVYAADGTLVAENDEMDYEDDVLDAGLSALALAAGGYRIEVGSYGDSSAGGYTLSVTAAK